MKPMLVLGLVLMLPGCAALSALQGEPARDVFELRPPEARSCRGGGGASLVVEPPKAGGALNTNRIMIRPAALQVQYLPDATWSDPVPVMLQTLLVRSLGESNAFAHVGREPLGVSGDYALLSDLSDFNAATGSGGTRVEARLDAQIVDEMSASILSRRTFQVTTPAAGTGTAQLMAAFDTATQQLVAEMSGWAIGAAGRCR